MQAASVDSLNSASIQTVLQSNDPQFVHIKDPFVYQNSDREFALLFCSHPFNWSSSNTGYALRCTGESEFTEPVFDFFPRGFTWDVAMTRGTSVVDVPQIGDFKETRVSLLFYDGGECLRNHDEHDAAVKRPRGYSCEELGGVAYILNGEFGQVHRLSRYEPMFISPWGTGCSRYVDVLASNDGFFATWQQSQADCSQPLVMNFLSRKEAEAILI